MSGFSKPHRVERNNKGLGILLYITEEIISKSMPISFNSNDLEYLLVAKSISEERSSY